MAAEGSKAQREAYGITRRMIAEAWLANGGNATKAMKQLRPHLTGSALRKAGCLLLREVRASGLLDARANHASRAMGVDELVERTSEVARANVLDFVTVKEDGSFAFDLPKAQKAGLGHLIKSLRHDAESGAPVLELYPADQARKVLGKWQGLGEKNAAPAGPSVAVMINVLGTLPADVQAQLFSALLTQGQADKQVVTDLDAIHIEDSDDDSEA